MDRIIDLNADLGEGFGRWQLTDDAALLASVTSANVACGFHAGDPATMRRVCEQAAEYGVRIGAQVSYRDLAGFGRRAMDVPAAELAAEVAYQIGALDVFARAAGSAVSYVKPHGALYNRTVHDGEQAAAVVEGVRLASVAAGHLGGAVAGSVTGATVGAAAGSAAGTATEAAGDGQPPPAQGLPAQGLPAQEPAAQGPSAQGPTAHGLPVLGLPGSRLLAAAAAAGLPTVDEAFADRGYRPDATLVPRAEPGAVLTDPGLVLRRAVRLAREGEVVAEDGQPLRLRARSLCVHGDTPDAARLARRVREELASAGVTVRAFA